MAEPLSCLSFELRGRRWLVGTQHYDLSIPLAFDRPQPNFFGVTPAREQHVVASTFTGDVRLGGSCNCSTYTLTPHCNGTHTECIGHLTAERLSVRDLCTDALSAALLISIRPTRASSTDESTQPQPQPGDLVLTRAAIDAAVSAAAFEDYRALVIRTLPNDASKLTRDYQREAAPYFTSQAMSWIVQRGIEHLVVDLPSVDRAEDEGYLSAHRIFWNLARSAVAPGAEARRGATITELAYIDEQIPDGPYLLNLQIAPFAADAAPSRPILMPLRPA